MWVMIIIKMFTFSKWNNIIETIGDIDNCASTPINCDRLDSTSIHLSACILFILRSMFEKVHILMRQKRREKKNDHHHYSTFPMFLLWNFIMDVYLCSMRNDFSISNLIMIHDVISIVLPHSWNWYIRYLKQTKRYIRMYTYM